MAFTVKFWNFAKDINSTKIPTATGTSYQCTLKDGCSMIAPEIQLQLTSSTTPLYNYAYIANFQRYYRVCDWYWENRLWTAKLRVDVLASWKVPIFSSTHYVLRAASERTGAIRDDYYPVTGAITTEYTAADDATPWWSINNTTLVGGSYIVGLISGNDIVYYAMAHSTFKNFCEKVLDPTLSNYGGSSLGVSEELAKMIFRPFDYVTSVNYIPVSILDLIGDNYDYVESDVSSWRIGFWTLNGVTGIFPLRRGRSYEYTKQITLPHHPQQSARGQYMDTEPFTQRYITLPRIGAVPLDTSILQDCTKVKVTLDIDLVTGEAVYMLHGIPNTGDVAAFLGRYSAQLGVTVQLAQQTMTFSQMLSTVESTTTKVASVAESPASIAGVCSGIVSLFEPHLSVVGNYGGFLEMLVGTASLISIYRTAAETDNTHFGSPLCKVKTLNTLSGYVKCGDGEIVLNNAFQDEIDEIETHLKEGIYLE